MVRTCQPTFSAAFIGFVESTFSDDAEKNRICTPIAPPNVPLDWLRMMRAELANRACWLEYPTLGDWMANSRLDPVSRSIRVRLAHDPEAMKHIGRYLENFEPAQAKLDVLLAD